MAYVNALMLLFAISALGIFIYGPWQQICVDYARNSIFSERDAIFDIAAHGRVSFESPEYQDIREGLNSLIRFAHKISWPWLALLILATKKRRTMWAKRSNISRGVQNIANPDVRSEIDQHVRRAMRATIILLFLRSPLLCLFFGFAIVVRKLGRQFRELAAPQERAIGFLADIIQKEAEEYEGDHAGDSREKLAANPV